MTLTNAYGDVLTLCMTMPTSLEGELYTEVTELKWGHCWGTRVEAGSVPPWRFVKRESLTPSRACHNNSSKDGGATGTMYQLAKVCLGLTAAKETRARSLKQFSSQPSGGPDSCTVECPISSPCRLFCHPASRPRF